MSYSPLVFTHFEQPRHAGSLPPGDGEVIEGRAGAVESGVVVSLAARIRDEEIADLAFRAFGCPHVIAACSLATEKLHGQPVAALAELGATELAAELDVPPAKLGRLLTLEDALRKCWQAWENN